MRWNSERRHGFALNLLGCMLWGEIFWKNSKKKIGYRGMVTKERIFVKMLGCAYKAMTYHPPWFLFQTRLFSTRLSPFVTRAPRKVGAFRGARSSFLLSSYLNCNFRGSELRL
jgi:hypothetical protein